jgi:hypothetical protein
MKSQSYAYRWRRYEIVVKLVVKKVVKLGDKSADEGGVDDEKLELCIQV